jgi:uncharacterized membrane protein
MMILSYQLGQKYYPVPYPVKKLISYLVLVVLIYLLHLGIKTYISNAYWVSIGTGILLFGLFVWFVSKIEAKELAKLPVVGKFFSTS